MRGRKSPAGAGGVQPPQVAEEAVPGGLAGAPPAKRGRGRPPSNKTQAQTPQTKPPKRVVVYKEGETPYEEVAFGGAGAMGLQKAAGEGQAMKLQSMEADEEDQETSYMEVLGENDEYERDMHMQMAAGVGLLTARPGASSRRPYTRKSLPVDGTIPILANFKSETVAANVSSGHVAINLQNYISEDGYYKEWPVFDNKPMDFQEACDIILGAVHVDESKICDEVPLDFRGEGTFIVDLEAFENKYAIHCDGMGQWGKPTSRTRYYKYNNEGECVRLDENDKQAVDAQDFDVRVVCKRYEHPYAHGLFYKKIYTGIQQQPNGWLKLAVVSYQWCGMPIDFQVPPPEGAVPHTQQPPKRHAVEIGNVVRKGWEMASRTAAESDPMAKEYGDCPLYSNGAIAFEEVAQIILGSLEVAAEKICEHVPMGFRGQGSFIVDMRRFDKKGDLRRDGNGIWGKPAGSSRYYHIDQATGIAVRVDRSSKLVSRCLCARADGFPRPGVIHRRHSSIRQEGRFATRR